MLFRSAAGAAFAAAVLTRPTNLLLAPALVVLIGWKPRQLLAFVAGGLPGAAWLAWYNHALYGHPLASGYGNIGAAFGVRYGAPTALHFGKWLALLLPAVQAARGEMLRAAASRSPSSRTRSWTSGSIGSTSGSSATSASTRRERSPG